MIRSCALSLWEGIRDRAGLKAILLLSLLFFTSPAFADDEARLHQLFRQFRCMVCQSQSLAESDAPLARDLRMVIREQVAAGKSDAEITEYLHSRYGDYILFAPPLNAGTSLLWFGPFILLIAGGIGIIWVIRKQNHAD